MIRTLLWLLAGVVLGGIIHIAVILSLPSLSATSAWDHVAAAGGTGPGPTVLAAATAGQPNPLRLDPELAYAVCRIDLRTGPASVTGTLPQAFWSVAVYNRAGTVVYSTTNRDGIGQTVELGIFNAAQTRLLAQQQLDIAEGLLVVESASDKLLILVRLAPPHRAMRARFEQELSEVECGTRG